MEYFQTLLRKQQNSSIITVYLSPSSFQVKQTIPKKIQWYFVLLQKEFGVSGFHKEKLEVSCLVKNCGCSTHPKKVSEAWIDMDQQIDKASLRCFIEYKGDCITYKFTTSISLYKRYTYTFSLSREFIEL